MQVPQLRVTRFVTLLCGSLLACDTFGPRPSDFGFTGIVRPCDNADSQQPIGWEEDSLLGAPSLRFTAFEGQCEAPLRLNDTAGDLAASQSTMRVEVLLDHDSARLVQYADARDAAVSCPAELVVDANVHLVSDDGLFDVSADTSVSFRSDTPTRISFTTPLRESKGTFEPADAMPGAKTTLSFQLEGPGESCAGEISATIVMESPGGSTGSHGPIGAWSTSECGLGERQLDPSQKFGGRTLPEQVSALWGRLELDGTWNDGSPTKLLLQLEAATNEVLCRRREGLSDVVTLPVQVRYSTDDGRIPERQSAANVRTELSSDDRISRLALWLSDETDCQSADGEPAYSLADCALSSAITIQLGLNSSLGSVASTGDNLTVYFTPRTGTESPDVARLSF